MHAWRAFPFSDAYPFDAERTRALWPRLHRCDAEPLPADSRVLEAWALFHAGHFQQAAQAGLAAGGAGITVANKATAVYANYLEPHEPTRLALFLQVAERAAAQCRSEPDNPAAWYWQAYALGRHSQCLSVAKALAQGLGVRVRDALQRAIALSPAHADARLALGAFHAEVIDKVGPMVARLTYGANPHEGERLFIEALALNPDSAMGLIEWAQAQLMLRGAVAEADAQRCYEQAACSQPADAKERLDVEQAHAALED